MAHSRSISSRITVVILAVPLLVVLVIALDFFNIFRTLGLGGFGALDTAWQELEAGNFDKSLRAAERAVRWMPEFQEAYVLRGNAHECLGHFEHALADYTKALKLSQTYPPIDAAMYAHRGRVYERQGDHDKAIKEYCIAISQTPDKHLPLICMDYITLPEDYGKVYARGEYDIADEARMFREAVQEMIDLLEEASLRNPDDENISQCCERLRVSKRGRR